MHASIVSYRIEMHAATRFCWREASKRNATPSTQDAHRPSLRDSFVEAGEPFEKAVALETWEEVKWAIIRIEFESNRIESTRIHSVVRYIIFILEANRGRFVSFRFHRVVWLVAFTATADADAENQELTLDEN